MSSRTVSLSSNAFSKSESQGKQVSKGKTGKTQSSGVSSRSEIQEFVSKIESMGHLSHVPIKNLEKKKQLELHDLRSAANLLRKGKSYGLVVDAIKRTFGSKKNLQPATVGAFFYGCFIDNDFEGCLACSALCAGSMPVPSVPGWKDCDKTVGVYIDGELSISYISESKEILVHVTSGQFQGLSEEDTKKLKKMGIEKVTISYSDSESGSSKSTFSGTPDSVCRKTVTETITKSYPSVPSSRPSQSNHHKEESGWGWGLIVAIVVLLLVFFLIAFAYYYLGSFKKSPETTVTETRTDHFYGPGFSH